MDARPEARPEASTTTMKTTVQKSKAGERGKAIKTATTRYVKPITGLSKDNDNSHLAETLVEVIGPNPEQRKETECSKDDDQYSLTKMIGDE